MEHTAHNRILLVDDEPALRRMVAEHLTAHGFLVVGAKSCAEARAALRAGAFDAAILDVMLPDGDGFSLFSELRIDGASFPVLFLSARDEDDARLRGLGLGADDYITKPFLLQELTLRLHAVLRRVYGASDKGAAPAVTLFGTRIDFAAASVVRPDGTEASLTGTEWKLLKKLWENRGAIVTTDALAETIWEDGAYGYENALTVHIRRLREKVEADPSHPQIILTARGLGYRLGKERGA